MNSCIFWKYCCTSKYIVLVKYYFSTAVLWYSKYRPYFLSTAVLWIFEYLRTSWVRLYFDIQSIALLLVLPHVWAINSWCTSAGRCAWFEPLCGLFSISYESTRTSSGRFHLDLRPPPPTLFIQSKDSPSSIIVSQVQLTRFAFPCRALHFSSFRWGS